MEIQTIEAEYQIVGIGPFTIEAEVQIDTEPFVDDAAPGSYYRPRGEEVTDATLIKATLGGVIEYNRLALIDFAGEKLVEDLEARAINAYADFGPRRKTIDDMPQTDMLALGDQMPPWAWNPRYVPNPRFLMNFENLNEGTMKTDRRWAWEDIVIFGACLALAGVVVAIGLGGL